MEGALRQAGLKPADVQHLNAHSTSTPVGDVSELEAIKTVFGREGAIAVSATKSATGHLLGAAGGAEAIFTILAVRDQVAPPTLNLENGDPAAEGVDIAAREARRMTIEHAIRRGAKPLAEIVGYGTTADAYHITSGPEDGDGARRAMERRVAAG